MPPYNKTMQKYSQLFGKTSFNETEGSNFISHQLLVKGGFIRESAAGRYFFLPLGWKVHDRIKRIIKEEMDKTGAQEMLTPTLHPLELWEETNRNNSVGFELMKIQDQRGASFALGGTAEEMFVDVVRKLRLSYRDLPLNIYQFSNKFRDEKRARGGLLRVREFMMKDAYSFDMDEDTFKKTYEQMALTYSTIFERLGLKTLRVAADNGYIGGEYCDEYQVESEIGEGRFFVSEDGKYVAHEDIAKFKREDKNLDEELKPLKEVESVRGNTMEDGEAFHKLPIWQQMKDVMFANEKNELILVVLRGDLDVNETKVMHLTGAFQLRPATEEEIRAIGSEPGFISPIGLHGKVKMIVGDTSIRTVRNFYGGANKKHKDVLNMNVDRDFKVDIEGDVAMAQGGFMTEDGKSVLLEKKGIEVGNIFQLGYHYSSRMHDASFVDKDGQQKQYYMGCYGIGLGRTLATIVEKYNDEKGIVWPKAVAPYHVHLINIGQDNQEQAEKLAAEIESSGCEVLWDEREVSPGQKFVDADLVGIPIRIVISKKSIEKGGFEVKERSAIDSQIIPADKLTDWLKGYYNA